MANLTSKELTGIEDQLNCEKILISKFNMYASMADDCALQNKLRDIANKHKNHYDTLVGLLG